MKTVIFLLITLMAGVCYGQDNIVVLVTNKNACGLSRNAEGYFQQRSVVNYLTTKRYKYVQYYGQDIDKKFHDRWQVKWYPTVVHLRKIDNKWYLHKVFDPNKVDMNYLNVLKFIEMPVQQPRVQPPRYTVPYGGGGST